LFIVELTYFILSHKIHTHIEIKTKNVRHKRRESFSKCLSHFENLL